MGGSAAAAASIVVPELPIRQLSGEGIFAGASSDWAAELSGGHPGGVAAALLERGEDAKGKATLWNF